ncbi:MAG: hypothetical protein DBY17_07035 [Oscillospiraceae bacterium]|nr:MAG: hypothetical protein DBY17_07035 [Oscillospiraceae bacterium]
MQGFELNFFLGGLSPIGFQGYYARSLPPAGTGRAVLIKAGPGCGKSHLMRTLTRRLTAAGHTVHTIRCSADPASLDGVICPALCLTVLDATAPHTLEPSFPQAHETVLSLYDALQETELRGHCAELQALHSRYKAFTDRAARYLAAAGSLLQDRARTAQCCTDLAKVRAFALSLSRRYLPVKKEKAPQESVRALSAVTADGVVFYKDTVRALCRKAVILDDAYGPASGALLAQLRKEILAKGYGVITCWCAMQPREKIDHLLVPELGLAFVTSGPFHVFEPMGDRVIHCTRFMNKNGLGARKARLKFDLRAAKELVREAGLLLDEARGIHRQAEAFYTSAMDFSKADAALERLCTSLGV